MKKKVLKEKKKTSKVRHRPEIRHVNIENELAAFITHRKKIPLIEDDRYKDLDIPDFLKRY